MHKQERTNATEPAVAAAAAAAAGNFTGGTVPLAGGTPAGTAPLTGDTTFRLREVYPRAGRRVLPVRAGAVPAGGAAGGAGLPAVPVGQGDWTLL